MMNEMEKGEGLRRRVSPKNGLKNDPKFINQILLARFQKIDIYVEL